MTNARYIAFRVLKDVRTKDAYANLALAQRISQAGLSSRDAAFATEITAGTLRLQGTYDRVIELASGRKLKAIDKDVLDILRLGTHQLLNTRVAPHAAVNESVLLTKKVGRSKAVGFVNAVMRRVSEKTLTSWHHQINKNSRSADEAQAQIYSHPEWIVSAFQNALANENREEEIEKLLTADNSPPKVSLVGLTESSLNRLREAGVEKSIVSDSGPSPLGFELNLGDPHKEILKMGVAPNTVRVQDQGSQLAALVLSRAKEIQAGELWADLCAGPGGKTAVLASEAAPFEIKVHANEISKHRADLVRDATTAFKNNVSIISKDGRLHDAFKEDLYDRIMVDAPCSGLGALRRRPEARWRKKETDIQQLTVLQSELLKRAAQHTAVAGIIAYVTCSPDLRETREIVDSFLEEHLNFIELNTRELIQTIASNDLDLGDGDQLSAQLWPHRHGTDAMFISLLRREH